MQRTSLLSHPTTLTLRSTLTHFLPPPYLMARSDWGSERHFDTVDGCGEAVEVDNSPAAERRGKGKNEPISRKRSKGCEPPWLL